MAALTGGLFIGLGLVYAFAIAHARLAGLGVCLMSIVVTVPTLGYTIINKDVFDFGRWQAVAWLILVAALPLLFLLVLIRGNTRSVGSGAKLPGWARIVMFALAVAAAVGATVLWISPTGSGWLPFTVSQFAGQLVGMWLATTAFACLWSAIRPVNEGQLFVFAACALLAGAIAGTVRTFGFLRHSQRGIYVIMLALALALCLGVLSVTGAPPRGIDRPRP